MGLSWIIVFKKRENFRKVFDDFDYKKVVNYVDVKIESLLKDEGIIWNKLKVRVVVINV